MPRLRFENVFRVLRRRNELEVKMIWLLVLLLVVLAIGGGLALSKFLFFLLLVAVVLALLGVFNGRTTV